jgi:hypothetical protein
MGGPFRSRYLSLWPCFLFALWCGDGRGATMARDAGPARQSGPVLLVDDGPAAADELYEDCLESIFGPGQWSLYDLQTSGLPDPVESFLGMLRQHRAVIWYTGTAPSNHLGQVTDILREYLQPTVPSETPGRLLLVSPVTVFSYGASWSLFLQGVLGVGPSPSPLPPFHVATGLTAIGWEGWLPDITLANDLAYGQGVSPLEGADILYRMEFCTTCYGGRPPYDPVVGVRRPTRAESPYARAVTVTLSLEHFQRSQVLEALTAIVRDELGIRPHDQMVTDGGLVNLLVTDQGYVGNLFSNPNQPSCEYPGHSDVEHLFQAGLWVGAEMPDGTVHVSCGAECSSNAAAAAEIREFADTADPVRIWSNDPSSPNYRPEALATHHIECQFDDDVLVESGQHVPLGIKVRLRALTYEAPRADDFVILDYTIVNFSGQELRNVFVGFWEDTTVGNTAYTNPYDPQAARRWNYYDDCNGGWRPGLVAGDPDLWMMWEHDDDGDEGLATSWIGTRLLGTEPEVVPAGRTAPVSYNAWLFRQAPLEDDAYLDGDGIEWPGKYQAMGNGDFDVGVDAEEDFTRPSNWNALLSTGPFPVLLPGDSVRVTFALVCGADSLSLLENSHEAQDVYDHGLMIVPTFLTSLSAVRRDAAAVIRWEVSRPDSRHAFRVWRQRPGGERVQIGAEIPADRLNYAERDAAAPSGEAVYWLQIVGRHGNGPALESWLGSATLAALQPSQREVDLALAAPNPFNPTTRLRYVLAQTGRVDLAIYDARGRRVASLIDDVVAEGEHFVTWDGRDHGGLVASSGVYIARLRTDFGVRTCKLVLAK